MTLYIARCLAALPGSDALHAATLVARAQTQEAVAPLARALLDTRGWRLLGLQDLTDHDSHLHSHGATELTSALIAALSDAEPVQLSHFFPVTGALHGPPPDPVLIVRRHAIAAPPRGDKRPFWDMPWCPPDLGALLQGGTKRSYALIDAARRAQLRGGQDMDLIATMADTACLYSGQAAEDMADVAPYLVDLTPFTQPETRVPAALRDLFHLHWPGGSVLILRSDASLDALRRHLRLFLRIRSSDDAETWTYFRFWDPATARIYFPGIATRPERVDRFFRTSPDLPLEMILPDGPDALHLIPRDARGPAQITDPIVFDAADHALMQQIADRAFCTEMAQWLTSAYPDRFAGLTGAQTDAAVAHVMAEGARLRLDRKDDYACLAHLMLTLGGWFMQAGHPAELASLFTSGGSGLHRRVQGAFLPAYQTSPQATLMQAWDDVQAHLSALPEQAQVTPEAFTAFVGRFLGPQTKAVDAALAATKRDLESLNLPLADQRRLLILTLIFGHRFYADPLRPSGDGPVATIVSRAWADLLTTR